MAANEVIKLSGFREPEDSSLVEPMEFSDELPAGTLLLNKQYTITGYLNSGGFGITYVAKDSLNRTVVIKECFPGFMCKRVGRDVHVRSLEHKGELASIVDAFINEAHALAALNHKGIVKVHQVFEENQTAYMAMDYVKGLDLAEIIDRHPGALSPTRVVRLTRRILNVVSYVHQRGILHRDISPDNILIAKSGEPMLIDFGSAYEHIKKAGTETAQLKFVKDGYSPQEFYLPDGDQGPWSDIYSLAATLYHLIMGHAPEAAQPRLAAIAKGNPDPYVPLMGAVQGYPPKFLKAMDKALSLMPEGRFQAADDWLARITKRKPAKPAVVTEVPADLFDTPPAQTEPAKGDAHANTPISDDEDGLMAAVQVAADLRDAHIRTIINEDDEPNKKSRGPILAIAGVTLALGVGAIGYLQFYGPIAQPNATNVETTAQVSAATGAQAPGQQTIAPVVQPDPQPLQAPDALTVAQLASLPSVPGTFANPTPPIVGDQSVAEMGVLVPQPAGQFPNAPLILQPSLQLSAVDAPVLPDVLARNATAAALAALPQISDVPPLALRLAPVSLPVPSAAAEQPASIPQGQSAFEEALVFSANLASQPSPDANVVADFVPPAPLPEPVVYGPVLDIQIAFSHWDVDMPFAAEMQQQRNAATALVTQLSATADFNVAGGWIAEGTRIFTYNGQTLDVNKALSGQILNTLMIDPDGYTRGTVRYRDPTSGQIDRGLLAVPVVREIGLADGTVIEGRIQGDGWRYTVISVSEGVGSKALSPGDLLLRENLTGINITSHEDISRIYERLIARSAPEANFQVERAGQVLNIAQPLARRVEDPS